MVLLFFFKTVRKTMRFKKQRKTQPREAEERSGTMYFWSHRLQNLTHHQRELRWFSLLQPDSIPDSILFVDILFLSHPSHLLPLPLSVTKQTTITLPVFFSPSLCVFLLCSSLSFPESGVVVEEGACRWTGLANIICIRLTDCRYRWWRDREGGVGTVQVNCISVSGSTFTVWLSAFVNIHTCTRMHAPSLALPNRRNVAIDSRSLSVPLRCPPSLLPSLLCIRSKHGLWKVNSQPAVDKLCVTCLAVLPYMETGVSEYCKALPRRKEGERERRKGGGGRKRGKGERKRRKKEGGGGGGRGSEREECREASMRFSLSILPSAAVRWVHAEIQ